MKRLSTIILVTGISICGGARAEGLTRHSQSATELRLQSSSGLILGSANATGITYLQEEETLVINLSGGLGQQVASNVLLGADLGINRQSSNGSSLSLFSFAPYLKFASNLGRGGGGGFFEGNFGFNVLSGAGDSILVLSAGAWAGAHAYVSESSALVVGPYITYLRVLEDVMDPDNVLIGFRFGISTYSM